MRISKSPYCGAINCCNNKGVNPELSFFYFPKDPERCNKWAINCRREDLMKKDIIYLHTNVRLCSNHFEQTQFMNEKRNSLVWNAIPTIFDIPNPPKSVFIKRKLPKRITKSKKCKPSSERSQEWSKYELDVETDEVENEDTKANNSKDEQLSAMKNEILKLKKALKLKSSPYPDWPYWKLMHSILSRHSLSDKKYIMDSFEIEMKKEGIFSEISDKINIEKSLEIEIEDQESDFQRFSIEDINIVEDKVNNDQRNSTDVSRVTETDEKKEFNANNLNNGNIGREDSPFLSDSISVVSEAAYSASSDDEVSKSVNSQNKQNSKRKTIHKDAIQELIEAEKRSYELQWKKLQIEIEVAKSMKTFFNSMAKMMDRILKPQSLQSSSQPFSQFPQNSNWSVPPPNYYPFPFIPNYSQPMPFPPFFQPFPCSNQNNSQTSDTNASTAVNNLTKETKEGNEGNKTT